MNSFDGVARIEARVANLLAHLVPQLPMRFKNNRLHSLKSLAAPLFLVDCKRN
jgi:hypothetical protein